MLVVSAAAMLKAGTTLITDFVTIGERVVMAISVSSPSMPMLSPGQVGGEALTASSATLTAKLAHFRLLFPLSLPTLRWGAPSTT